MGKKRELFESKTNANDANFNQNDMARSSGDNDGDRVVDASNPEDKAATDEAYFNPQRKPQGDPKNSVQPGNKNQ